MNTNERWSKKIDSSEVNVLSEFRGDDMSIDKILKWLEYLSDGVKYSVAACKEGNTDHAFDFMLEPEYDEFGLDYKGGFENLYNKLVELTDEGYDVREYWRQFRDNIRTIWVSLPDYSNYWEQSPSGSALEKPEDYDPNKPFPQYPIPEDID